MLRKKLFGMAGLLALLMVVFAAAGCDDSSGGGGTSSPFKLQSSAFSNNQRLAVKYCYNGVAGGQNVSLPFNWIEPPEGTKSFALVIYDPDGGNWVHWAVFNIPATTSSIAEGASGSGMPQGCDELTNSFGTAGYGGPQPPEGSGIHRYISTLYALNTETISGLNGEKSYAQLNAILAGKVIGQASITGTYSR